MRKHLQRIIIQAWVDSIEKFYNHQRINSERSLQACLWSNLDKLIGPNRRTFIEPRISYKQNGRMQKIYPDIVICNRYEVVAVIELKYHPKSLRPFTKDLQSLNVISKYRDKISLRNSRHKGIELDSKQYTCSDQILFVWAGVHRGTYDEKNWAALNFPYLMDSYLELHAETKDSRNPDIYYYA